MLFHPARSVHKVKGFERNQVVEFKIIQKQLLHGLEPRTPETQQRLTGGTFKKLVARVCMGHAIILVWGKTD